MTPDELRRAATLLESFADDLCDSSTVGRARVWSEGTENEQNECAELRRLAQKLRDHAHTVTR